MIILKRPDIRKEAEMRTREEIMCQLNTHSSDTPSKWREKAEWRNANKSWVGICSSQNKKSGTLSWNTNR